MMLVSEQLPVSDHKLPFFRRSFHKSHKGFQCMIKIFVGGGEAGVVDGKGVAVEDA